MAFWSEYVAQVHSVCASVTTVHLILFVIGRVSTGLDYRRGSLEWATQSRNLRKKMSEFNSYSMNSRSIKTEGPYEALRTILRNGNGILKNNKKKEGQRREVAVF